EAGMERARSHLSEADCRVIVLDASQPGTTDDCVLLAAWPDAIVVANKSDLPDAWGSTMPNSAYRVSSITGDGVDALIEAIVARRVPRVPTAGTAIPVSERQVTLLRKAREAMAAGDTVT